MPADKIICPYIGNCTDVLQCGKLTEHYGLPFESKWCETAFRNSNTEEEKKLEEK